MVRSGCCLKAVGEAPNGTKEVDARMEVRRQRIWLLCEMVFRWSSNGEVVGMVKDAAYQSNTQEFWNSCTAICDEKDYRLNGSFFDGKGQPGQVSAVSHGCATARFNGINVINTGRKI